MDIYENKVRGLTPDPPTKLEEEEGTLKIIIAIILAVLVCIVMMGVIWIQLSDRLNANDAYRTKWIIEQRDGYRKVCESNAKTFNELKEWLHQNKIEPPPEFMVADLCIQPDTSGTEAPKEDH